MSGYIGFRKVPQVNDCSGVWTLREQAQFQKDGIWLGYDPYFANVSLLLHFDGANDSTTFTDSSANNLTITPYGDAKISTVRSKFGGSSGRFDGVGDYLYRGTSSTLFGFETGNFTVEFFIYLNILPSGSSKITFMDFRADIGYTPHTIFIDSQGYLGFYNGGSDITSSLNPLYPEEWMHVAYSRSNNVLKIFVNGNQAYSASHTTNYLSARALTIGGAIGRGASEFFNGYVDELRITKGVARYTGNFTPPTAPFPNR